MTSNPFLLAADNSPALLPLLRDNMALASSQDEHGYSLIHAAASYNHLDLLRTLVQDFKADVNLKDEDNETALFVVETPEAAKLLVELGVDVNHKNDEGWTARQKIETESEFPEVVAYLDLIESSNELGHSVSEALPQAPQGLRITVGTMDETEDVPPQVDAELRRRIEELAQRSDFSGPEGQADLRRLVEDALLDQGLTEDRNVRHKHA